MLITYKDTQIYLNDDDFDVPKNMSDIYDQKNIYIPFYKNDTISYFNSLLYLGINNNKLLYKEINNVITYIFKNIPHEYIKIFIKNKFSNIPKAFTRIIKNKLNTVKLFRDNIFFELYWFYKKNIIKNPYEMCIKYNNLYMFNKCVENIRFYPQSIQNFISISLNNCSYNFIDLFNIDNKVFLYNQVINNNYKYIKKINYILKKKYLDYIFTNASSKFIKKIIKFCVQNNNNFFYDNINEYKLILLKKRDDKNFYMLEFC